MNTKLILASASAARQEMLRNAGVSFLAVPARTDESAIKKALLSEGYQGREVADALAEAKARQVSASHPESVVIGSDQVLEFEGKLLSKPRDIPEARKQLLALRGKNHKLLSAAVLYQNNVPLWRYIATVTLTMREFSHSFLEGYLEREGQGVCDTVGSYKLEREGVRLFSRIDGDYFSVLGMPLLEILAYLEISGKIEG